MATSSSHYLETLLALARPFLRGELKCIDRNLPSLVGVLRASGASECWHKNANFLEHLFDIYCILKIWGAKHFVCLTGLFHSAYSRSFASLAVFEPDTRRDVVRGLVGDAAERLIYLIFIVPRYALIQESLLFSYSDEVLVEHLKLSEISLRNAKGQCLFNVEEAWSKKLNTLLPAIGITVKNMNTGEDLLGTRRFVALYLLMIIADVSDQFYGFQDSFFNNVGGRLEFTGNNYASLWLGDGKPRLWMNSISRIGVIYSLIVREEDIFIEERKRGGGVEIDKERDEDIELVMPPVFEKCTKVLGLNEQIEGRDLYWEAICEGNKQGIDKAEELLLKCIGKNPFIGEPHVVLSQIYLTKGMFEEAEIEAEKGLILLMEWEVLGIKGCLRKIGLLGQEFCTLKLKRSLGQRLLGVSSI